MRKIITYLLLSYGITTASFAQQDSTLLLLDKTEITSNLLYPSLENDSTTSWLKLSGDNKTKIDLSKFQKGIYLYKVKGQTKVISSDKIILKE